MQFTSYLGCIGKGEFIDPVFIEMMFLNTLEIDARSTNSVVIGPLIKLNTEG